MSRGFEYTAASSGPTLFETFLKYTNEKQKTSEALAKQLSAHPGDTLRLLDVGTGNGENVALVLGRMTDKLITLTAMEPSVDLAGAASRNLTEAGIPHRIVNEPLETFEDDEPFDAVIASHMLYDIPPDLWGLYMGKMLDLADTPDGEVIIIHRGDDQVAEIKNRFRPLLLGKEYLATTDQDVTSRAISSGLDGALEDVHYTDALLTIPKDDEEATWAILEFLLHAKREHISQQLQMDIVKYLDEHDWQLHTKDALITLAHLPRITRDIHLR